MSINYRKEEAISQAVFTNSIMITVVILDIPGAFLHTDLNEKVIMLLCIELAELMVIVDPKFKPANRKKLVYVRILKRNVWVVV